MAFDIEHFTVTIPAHTPLSSPLTVAIAMNPRTVSRIDWRVPPGPMGVFGWQLAMGGIRVFPTGGDQYVIADKQSGYWLVSDAPDSGAWEVIGYNTGAQPHSVALAFHTDVPSRRPAVKQLLAAYELMPAPDLSKAGAPVKRP